MRIAIILGVSLGLALLYLIFLVNKRKHAIRYAVGKCMEVHDVLLASIRKREDYILEFTGAARFRNLTEESEVPQLLFLRSQSIKAESSSQIFAACHETTIYLEELGPVLRNNNFSPEDPYSIHLNQLIASNSEVRRNCEAYMGEFVATRSLLLAPLSKLSLKLSPQPLPPMPPSTTP